MPMHNWSLLPCYWSFLPVPPKLSVCMYHYYMYYWYCRNDQQVISLCNIGVGLLKWVNPEPNVVGFLWVLRFPQTGRKIYLKKVSTFMNIWLALHAFIVDLQARDSKQYILPVLIICTFSFLFSCLNQSAVKNDCIQHKYNDVDINWYLVFFKKYNGLHRLS
jgi:hypothetical protein